VIYLTNFQGVETGLAFLFGKGAGIATHKRLLHPRFDLAPPTQAAILPLSY
jgi:hypothetical protein